MGKHCDSRKGADGQAAAHISSNGPVLGPNIACVPKAITGKLTRTKVEKMCGPKVKDNKAGRTQFLGPSDN